MATIQRPLTACDSLSAREWFGLYRNIFNRLVEFRVPGSGGQRKVIGYQIVEPRTSEGGGGGVRDTPETVGGEVG